MTNCEDIIIDELNALFKAYQLRVEKVQEQQEIIQNMLESSEQIFRLTKEITEIVAREEVKAIIKKESIQIELH